MHRARVPSGSDPGLPALVVHCCAIRVVCYYSYLPFAQITICQLEYIKVAVNDLYLNVVL